MIDLSDRNIAMEADEAEDTLKDRYLTFFLGKENYAIEIRYVTEIIGRQNITEMPELPEYFKGILNLRGRIIPIMDARLRFKKEPREYTDRTCIIVFNLDGILMGLVVDSVTEVLTIPEESVVELARVSESFENRYIKKVAKTGSEIKMIVDCRKLLSKDELEGLTEFAEIQADAD
ncbi:chemotaxis protein CheW [Parasporobacterium paucivorans]|uniref:Purine-binding chemotaxis protein CheW n=1 Tax=Parasporobacterium paucivorans DSM 15970 TaxID=1122934 RepID=A0A1M6DQT2_9FIRM|nr:chemotaxis protein CheW [Parasporobacterium paucivorans]SHI75510.1 purine-binding chemotaxis protein CheW [Parasporobacterium paucivorans DSM 15970]